MLFTYLISILLITLALCNKILLFYDCMLLNCGDFLCIFVDHDKNETFNIFNDLIKSIVTCLLDLKKSYYAIS
jgi:hypothetical protein